MARLGYGYPIWWMNKLWEPTGGTRGADRRLRRDFDLIQWSSR